MCELVHEIEQGWLQRFPNPVPDPNPTLTLTLTLTTTPTLTPTVTRWLLGACGAALLTIAMIGCRLAASAVVCSAKGLAQRRLPCHLIKRLASVVRPGAGHDEHISVIAAVWRPPPKIRHACDRVALEIPT